MNIILLDLVSTPYLDNNLPATEFRLFKFGVNKAFHFGNGDEEINFDQKDAQRFKDKFDEAGVDLLIDFNHKSLDPEASNMERRAAGWIKGLEIRDDGLYASPVEWIDDTYEMIKQKQYKYISPSYSLDYEDDCDCDPDDDDEEDCDCELTMDRLLPAALTNIPALKDIDALMNSNEKRKMNTAKNKHKKDKKMSDKQEIETFSLADMEKVRAELQAAKQEKADLEIEKALDKAILDRKLPPAKKAEFASVGKKAGLETLNMMLSALIVQLPETRHTEKLETSHTASETLSAFEAEVIEKSGRDTETFLKEKKKVQVLMSGATQKMTAPIKIKLDKAREGAKKQRYFVGIK